MNSSQNGYLTEQKIVDNMAILQNDELTKWKCDKMASC